MLLIDTKIDNSSIHGIGLFTLNEIKRGTQIWVLNPLTTQVFWKKQFLNICSTLPKPVLEDFIKFSYVRNGSIYTLSDNTRFINHSFDPNIGFQNDKSLIALKDIAPGEELVENYHQSYDEVDFFFLDLPLNLSKQEIMKVLKENILSSGRPKTRFLA